MELYESIRLQQDNIIAQNKASIIITRTTRSDDGAGGWKTTITTLASQDIRIYSKRTRTLNIDDGGWHSIRVTKGIAKYDANIKKKSANNEDKFTYDSKTYRIFDVIDRYVKGSIVFKELELEEI